MNQVIEIDNSSDDQDREVNEKKRRNGEMDKIESEQ